VSAQLHALAEALQVTTEGRSGDNIVAEVCTKADALLAQLPDRYQQPLLSRDSLTEAQVGSSRVASTPEIWQVLWTSCCEYFHLCHS
jgi:hypothetical protein